MGAEIDCCVGVDNHDHALTAAIELDVMKKTLESQKKSNRHFKQQKEVEIRKYRKRICVLEEERGNLIQQIRNEEGESVNLHEHPSCPDPPTFSSSDMALVA